MNENEITDLPVSADEAENVTGGYATPEPTHPAVPTALQAASPLMKAVTPMNGTPSK